MKKTVLAIGPASPYTNLLASIQEHLDDLSVFKQNFNNLHIIQLGAGGTGGYVAYEILRMLGNIPEMLKPYIHYTLMDGDVYEPKNLGRQLCCEDDIGKYKAKVLVEDYGELFGVTQEQASHIDEYFTDISQLAVLPKFPLPIWTVFVDNDVEKFFKDSEAAVAFNSKKPHINEPATSFIIIDCVDKNAPRKLLHDYFADIDSLPGSLARLNYCVNAYPDLDKITATGQQIMAHHSGGDSLLGSMYGITPIRDIYIISSGNGKYTGQVSWGRKSFLGNSGGAMHYKDIFGDKDVSSIIGPKINAGQEAEPAEITPEMTDADVNQLRLKALAEQYFTSENTKYLKNNLFQEIVEPATGALSKGYIRSIPIPMKNLEDPELESGHPMLKNMNMFMSAFMSTPTPYDRFPELTDLEIDKREEAMSCAERAEHNVQSINANKTAAALVVNYFTSIFNGMYMFEKEVPVLTTETTRFNILTGEYSSDPINTNSLRIPVATRERLRVQ